MGAIEATLEHGVSGIGGALLLLATQVLRERFVGAKPIEDSTSVITNSFTNLTDKLDQEIDRQAAQIADLRSDNHKLRNDLQKLKAYAYLTFQHIDLLEKQLIAAGMVLPDRPTLPSLN